MTNRTCAREKHAGDARVLSRIACGRASYANLHHVLRIVRRDAIARLAAPLAADAAAARTARDARDEGGQARVGDELVRELAGKKGANQPAKLETGDARGRLRGVVGWVIR